MVFLIEVTVLFWKRNDIVAVSPSVYTETMKTITKTQTFEYAIQSGSIWKRNEMKTERFENVSVKSGPGKIRFFSKKIVQHFSDSKLRSPGKDR